MTGSTPRAVAFAIRPPLARADLPGLGDRVCALLAAAGAAAVVECTVEGVEPDAVTVEALARLHLAARRRGCQVKLRGASEPLRELVAFMGLESVLTPEAAAGGRTAGTRSACRGRT